MHTFFKRRSFWYCEKHSDQLFLSHNKLHVAKISFIRNDGFHAHRISVFFWLFITKHFYNLQELKDEVIPFPADFVIHSPVDQGQYVNPNIGPEGFRWQPNPLIPNKEPVVQAVMGNVELPAVVISSMGSVTPKGSVSELTPETGPVAQGQKLGASGKFDSSEESKMKCNKETTSIDLSNQSDKVIVYIIISITLK